MQRTTAHTLVDRGGFLAIRGPLGNSWDRPYKQTVYYISKIKLTECERWLGARSRRIEGDRFEFVKDSWRLPVDTEGWKQEIEETEIKPPGRGSKYFEWVWRSGRWQKRAK